MKRERERESERVPADELFRIRSRVEGGMSGRTNLVDLRRHFQRHPRFLPSFPPPTLPLPPPPPPFQAPNSQHVLPGWRGGGLEGGVGVGEGDSQEQSVLFSLFTRQPARTARHLLTPSNTPRCFILSSCLRNSILLMSQHLKILTFFVFWVWF